MATPRDEPVLDFRCQAEWALWLDEHHATATGAVLRFVRKGHDPAAFTQPQALEVALCFGWIDGQARREDDVHWLLRFTPRGKRSIWSEVNRASALRYIAEGKMQPAGLAEVERAQADGRWEAAYAPSSRAEVPPDLQAALDAEPRAKAFFATLNARNRYAVLFRTHTAKRPETRARRIAQFVAMLARGETLHP